MPRLIKIFSGACEANNPASRPSLILPAPRGRSAQPSLRIPAIVNARSRQNRSRWAGIGVHAGPENAALIAEYLRNIEGADFWSGISNGFKTRRALLSVCLRLVPIKKSVFLSFHALTGI